MGARTDELLGLVDNLLAVHDAWADDPNRPNPDEVYWEAVDQLTSKFNEGSLPAPCRGELEKAVQELHLEFETADEVGYFPGDKRWGSCWRAIEVLRRARAVGKKQSAPLRLESIAELRKLPGMQDSQIARMYARAGYDFLDDVTGEPAEWKVQEELDKPGKWTAESRRRKVETDVAPDEDDESKRVNPRKVRECPETIEQLVRQGVGDDQICRMKQCTVGDIAAVREAIASGAGTSGTSGDASTVSREQLEREVIEASRGGMELDEIAASLGTTLVEVEAILRSSRRTGGGKKGEEKAAATGAQ